jgi:hypothetical protein
VSRARNREYAVPRPGATVRTVDVRALVPNVRHVEEDRRPRVAVVECDSCTWSRSCPTEGEAEAALKVHGLACPAKRGRRR